MAPKKKAVAPRVAPTSAYEQDAPTSAYEQDRLASIAANNAMLLQLGLMPAQIAKLKDNTRETIMQNLPGTTDVSDWPPNLPPPGRGAPAGKAPLVLQPQIAKSKDPKVLRFGLPDTVEGKLHYIHLCEIMYEELKTVVVSTSGGAPLYNPQCTQHLYWYPSFQLAFYSGAKKEVLQGLLAKKPELAQWEGERQILPRDDDDPWSDRASVAVLHCTLPGIERDEAVLYAEEVSGKPGYMSAIRFRKTALIAQVLRHEDLYKNSLMKLTFSDTNTGHLTRIEEVYGQIKSLDHLTRKLTEDELKRLYARVALFDAPKPAWLPGQRANKENQLDTILDQQWLEYLDAKPRKVQVETAAEKLTSATPTPATEYFSLDDWELNPPYDEETYNECTVDRYLQSEVHIKSLPVQSYPAMLGDWQALSAGCIRCLRAFHEPPNMYILDTERNEMLQRLLDPKFTKQMARPPGSKKPYLDEADAHDAVVAALAAVRTRLGAATAPRGSLAAFACIAEVPKEGRKERVLDEDMFNLMHGMDVVDIGAPFYKLPPGLFYEAELPYTDGDVLITTVLERRGQSENARNVVAWRIVNRYDNSRHLPELRNRCIRWYASGTSVASHQKYSVPSAMASLFDAGTEMNSLGVVKRAQALTAQELKQLATLQNQAKKYEAALVVKAKYAAEKTKDKKYKEKLGAMETDLRKQRTSVATNAQKLKRLERQKEAHENGEAELLDEAAEVALDIANENKKNPNARRNAAKQERVLLFRYKNWRASSNLCFECGGLLESRNLNLVHGYRPMELQLERGAPRKQRRLDRALDKAMSENEAQEEEAEEVVGLTDVASTAAEEEEAATLAKGTTGAKGASESTSDEEPSSDEEEPEEEPEEVVGPTGKPLTLEEIHAAATARDASSGEFVMSNSEVNALKKTVRVRQGTEPLACSYVSWILRWRRAFPPLDAAAPPPFDARVLLRMGEMTPEEYATRFREQRGASHKNIQVECEISTASQSNGLLSTPKAVEDAIEGHRMVVDQLSTLMRGETLKEQPCAELAEALTQLGEKHKAALNWLTNADASTLIDGREPTYEWHRGVAHHKKRWYNEKTGTIVHLEDLQQAYKDDPVILRQLELLSHQGRSVQQTKLFVTVVMHRRATQNTQHSEHIMSQMARSFRWLFSTPDMVASWLRWGIIWRKDHWEHWAPRKDGAETTGIGHYERNDDHFFNRERYSSRLENKALLRKFWDDEAGRARTLKADHAYVRTFTGPMLLPGEYASDVHEDVCLSIDAQVGCEIGPHQKLFHAHLLIDVKHLSKCYLDRRAVESFCIAAWTGALTIDDGTPKGDSFKMTDPSGRNTWIQPHERLYIDIKTIAEDDVQAAMTAYVTKQAIKHDRAALISKGARSTVGFAQEQKAYEALQKSGNATAAQLGRMAKWTASGLSTLNAPNHRSAVGDTEAHDNLRPYETKSQGLSNMPSMEHVQPDPLQSNYNTFVATELVRRPNKDTLLRPYGLISQDTPPFGDCAFYAVLQKETVTDAVAAEIQQLRTAACKLRTEEDPSYVAQEDESKMAVYVGRALLKYVARGLKVDILEFDINLQTGKLDTRATAMLKEVPSGRRGNEFAVEGKAAITQWLAAHPDARVILYAPSLRDVVYLTDAQGRYVLDARGRKQVVSDSLRGHYYACVPLGLRS